MDRIYLLDTSIFRSLSKDILNKLVIQGYRLYASPYVFWELLSHLDEKEGFERWKKELLKLKFAIILDDPRLELEKPLLINDSELQEHVPDVEFIEPALDALYDSNKLENFYGLYIKDSRNHLHEIADCASLARKILDERERRYKELVKKIMQHFSNSKIYPKTEQDCNKIILNLVETYIIYLKECGASEIGLQEKIINERYIYFSYMFHRTMKYFNNNNNNPELNDFEDGYMCMHLRLDTVYCFVSNDKETRDALSKTKHLINNLNDPKFNTTLTTCNADDLKNLSS